MVTTIDITRKNTHTGSFRKQRHSDTINATMTLSDRKTKLIGFFDTITSVYHS